MSITLTVRFVQAHTQEQCDAINTFASQWHINARYGEEHDFGTFEEAIAWTQLHKDLLENKYVYWALSNDLQEFSY